MMKKIFINKLINILAAAGLLFSVLSCSNSIKNEQRDEGFVLRVNVSELAEENTGARTITPDVELDDLTDVIFYGAKNGDTLKQLKAFDTIDDLQNAEIIIPFESTYNEWTFKLSAKKDNIEYSGTTKQKLSYTATNTISFVLSIVDLGSDTGTGSFTLTIDWPMSDNEVITDWITSAEAVFETVDGTNITSVNYGTEDGVQNQIQLQTNNLEFSVDNLTPGNYRVKVQFFFLNERVAYWQEVVQIAEDTTSTAERHLTYVRKGYRLVYHLNDEDDPANPVSFSTTRTVAFEYEKYVGLDTPTRDNYYFDGWYTDAGCTKPVKFPVSRDTDLYANWISLTPYNGIYPVTYDSVLNVVANITEGTIANPAVIKVYGEVYNAYFGRISNAMYNNNSVYFKVDMSAVKESSSNIAGSQFEKITNLVEISIPDDVETIGGYAFTDCTNLQKVTLGKEVWSIAGSAFEYTDLKEIELSAENEDLTVQNNVLYDADMETIITYPVGSTATTFEIPATVTNIGYGVFHGADNLTTVTAADTTASWYLCSASNYVNQGYLIRYNNKLEPLTVNDLKNGSGYDIYKVTAEEMEEYLYDFFGDTSAFESVNVYKSESFNVSQNEQEPFTIATGEQYKYTFYKISTEPGAKYTINFCNYYNSSDFTNIPDDIEFSSPNLYAFTTDGKQIGENSSNNTTLSFMAEGTVTYIGFYDDWENCGWAFRVWEREVITGVSVSVNPLSEIEVTETLMEDYDPDVLHFEVNDSTTYDSYEWYLDDVKDTNSTSTVFNVELGRNLTPGVHAVMLIAKKGSKYYSYTAQFWKD